jgi:hypothetical protein
LLLIAGKNVLKLHFFKNLFSNIELKKMESEIKIRRSSTIPNGSNMEPIDTNKKNIGKIAQKFLKNV